MRGRTTLALCLLLLAACDGLDPAAPAPLPEGEQAGPLALPPTIVVLPDTQLYAIAHPEILAATTRWIADRRQERNLQLVVHVGDVVDANTERQWTAAAASLRALDGIVPYAIAPGNHDYTPGSRETLLDHFFPVDELERHPTFGGVFEPGRSANSYHVVEVGDEPWLVLALEFAPRDEVIAWASGVLRRHAGFPAILVTHAYLYTDGSRYASDARPGQRWHPATYDLGDLQGTTRDGEDVWRALVAPSANVRFVLCGHALGEGVARRTSVRPDGSVVHQLLANYQMRPLGGGGYLRLLELLPGGQVQVRTYSPYLGRSLTDPANEFILEPAADAGW